MSVFFLNRLSTQDWNGMLVNPAYIPVVKAIRRLQVVGPGDLLPVFIISSPKNAKIYNTI
jgi:hypothetical protein